MRNTNFIPQPRFVRIRTRGRLTHWQVDDAVYFLTFGLRDAIPEAALEAISREREQVMHNVATDAERAQLDRVFHLRVDSELDTARGSCILRHHAEVVANALKYFHGVRYDLHAWCVMPNHVHVLMHLARGADMPKIIHSWKSYTAHQIDRGAIWQREYFDRVIRSPQEFSDTRAYIHNNPAKAGLRNWPWVG